MIYEDVFQNELTIFIAKFTHAKSISMEHIYPSPILFERMNDIVHKIFSTCETIFGNKDFSEYSHTFFTIPFRYYESIARILIDINDNEGLSQNEIIITVLFMSDNISQDHLNNFDELLNTVFEDYLSHKKFQLETYYELFKNTYDHVMQIQNLEVKIDENYTLTSAVNDFKKGIQFYQDRKWKTAYPFLKRALLKFQKENQEKLIIECLYLIGNLLVQIKKYFPALEYFDELEKQAIRLQHQKYIELTHFMQGFCNFKNHEYKKAIEDFKKINPLKAQFINRLHFYSFKGRIFSKLQDYDEAIENLNLAKAQIKKLHTTSNLLEQEARLEYDLGINYFLKLINQLKSGRIDILRDKSIINKHLTHIIQYFNKAGNIWDKTGNISNLLEIHSRIGDIYGYLGETTHQIKQYHFALEKAELLNDFSSRISLILHLIQMYDNNHQYRTKIELLQKTLLDFDQYIFIDNPTQALFHLEIGKAFKNLNDFNSANYELITSLNIYKKIVPPLKEERVCLEELINLHTLCNDKRKIEYYSDQLKIFEENHQIQVVGGKDLQYYIHDFWIITLSGLEIFSFNPHISLDPTLFGGFITALQCFSREISQEEIQSFVLGENRYIFYYEEDKDFYILGRVAVSESEKLIEKILRKIYDRFYREFKQYLTPFYGEIHPFYAFNDIMKSLDINLLD